MATKKSSGVGGGILVFLGSLIYLYVVYAWYYSAGGMLTPWVSIASFFGPFVLGLAIVSAVTLFFKGIKGIAGQTSSNSKHPVLWKFTNMGGVLFLIITGGTAWFTWALIGFILTYLGAMWESM